MLTSADPNTNRPITTASQSSFNRAFSATGSDTFTARSDIRLPQPDAQTSGEKPALIQGNMTAKPERQQSHRISLFPGLQHVRSRQCQIERMNHLLTCRNN